MEKSVNVGERINHRSCKSSNAHVSLTRGRFSSGRMGPHLHRKAQSLMCGRGSSEIIIQGLVQTELGRCPVKTASGTLRCLHVRPRGSGISWAHRAARSGTWTPRCVTRLGQNARPHKQPPSVDYSRKSSDSSSASAAMHDNLQDFQMQSPPRG